VILVCAVVVVLAVGFLLWRGRQHNFDDPRRPQRNAMKDRVLVAGSAVATAQIPADPRTAVLACYRGLEAVLAHRGAVRRRAETPSEFLLRATIADDVSAQAARRLCELFDEARFSAHPLEPAVRDEALAALRHVRGAFGEPS
jgi:nitrogen fixation-related uncharacterized protein